MHNRFTSSTRPSPWSLSVAASKRLQIYRLSMFCHLHRIDSWVLRRWTHDHREARPFWSSFTRGHDQTTLLRLHEPGSNWENVLGRLQISMNGGSPPWPLSSLRPDGDGKPSRRYLCYSDIYRKERRQRAGTPSKTEHVVTVYLL